VPYGTNIGGKGQAIRIDSDHGDKITRKPIVDKLRKMGYVRGHPLEPKTKLEYVTHAIDEFAPGADKAFIVLANDLKSKLAATLRDAKSGAMHQLAAPAEDGYFTGVPVADLKNWLGTDYAQIKPLVKDFLDNRTSDSVYLQATVGIIPSGMRTFLRDVAQPGAHVKIDPPSAARRKVLGIVDGVIGDLENDKAFANHKWVKGLGATSYEAFLGILSLVYTYLLGDVLHKTSGGTSSTAKNAVPFLIKHGPWDLVELAGTVHMRDNPPPRGLARTIGRIFKKSKYLKLAYWVESGDESATKDGLIKKPLEAQAPGDTFLEGDYVDIVEALLGSKETLFTLLRGLVHTPRYTATLGKELPGMDELATDSGGVDIGYESSGQSAIPLEYRWIQKRYKVKELSGPMFEIIASVRRANASVLGDEESAKVGAAVKR
jgi:hypothetical protein